MPHEGEPLIRTLTGHWSAALGEVLRSWRPLVLFQIWYALIVGAILSSAAGWLLNRLVRTTGSAAITNGGATDPSAMAGLKKDSSR